MRHTRMLGLAAVVAAALMAWVGAGAASATEITCGASTHSKCAVGTVLHASSIGKTVFDAPFGNVECETTMGGSISGAGASTTTATGSITTLDWYNCSTGTFTTLAGGSFEIHTDPVDGPSNGNGILRSNGTRITTVHLGIHCVYETIGTKIGTVTGSTNTNGHAILFVSADIPRVGGGGGMFCGSSVPWTSVYTVKTPATLQTH